MLINFGYAIRGWLELFKPVIPSGRARKRKEIETQLKFQLPAIQQCIYFLVHILIIDMHSADLTLN
jgi:hypothetical protein